MVSFPRMGNSGEFSPDGKFWWVSPRWEILDEFSSDGKFWWLSEESQQQPRCFACPDEFRTSVDDLFIFVHPGFLISACIPVDNCTAVFVCLLWGGGVGGFSSLDWHCMSTKAEGREDFGLNGGSDLHHNLSSRVRCLHRALSWLPFYSLHTFLIIMAKRFSFLK